MTRTEWDREWQRLELLHDHPLVNAVEWDIRRRDSISFFEAYRHPIAFLLLIVGLFGFAWVCGCFQ